MADVLTVFRTPWFEIEAVSSLPDKSSPEPYYRIRQGDGVIVLAISKASDFLLVRQYRPPIERYTLEIPAGMIEAGETPQDAARRELHEETGYWPGELVYLSTGRLMSNRVISQEHMLLARDCEPDPKFVRREDIEVVPLRPQALRDLITAGSLEQMAALATLYAAKCKFGIDLLDPAS